MAKKKSMKVEMWNDFYPIITSPLTIESIYYNDKLIKALEKEIQKLRKENEKLKAQLSEKSKTEVQIYKCPLFPIDFELKSSLIPFFQPKEDVIQKLIMELHQEALNLKDGEYLMTISDPVAVIVLRDGNYLHTIVTNKYYENISVVKKFSV